MDAKSRDADAEGDSAERWDARDETEPLAQAVVRRVSAAIAPGDVLAGRYEVHQLIGRGGAGEVFKATDRELGERVALKALRSELAADHRWRRRLVRELRVARAIRHPNVCRVFELGADGGRPFITMELATGGTLRDVLLSRAATDADSWTMPDPSRDAGWPGRLADARAVCAGLASLHAVGITHRDVTPQNVLRMDDGRLVLSDFGLALAGRETTTFQGGTPAYMAPEVLAGANADQRADVWQLGLLLHHLLFARAAEWDRRGTQISLRRLVSSDVSVVVDELAALCAACLSHDPTVRPASAVEVAGRLAAAEIAKPRGFFAKTFLRARRAARRPEVRLALVALVVTGVGVEIGHAATSQRLCQGGAAKVSGVWAGSARAAVKAAFVRSGSSRATDVFATVDRMIDDHLRRWVGAYTDACEATHVRGEQSAEVLDLRIACLNDDLDATRTLARVLTDADATMVDHAAEAASTLDDFSRCATVRGLRELPTLPRDPMARQAVEAQRHEVIEAEALRAVNQFSKSLVIADRAIKDAETIADGRGVAQALAVKGGDLCQLGLIAQAESTEKRALMLAEEAGDQRTMAVAAAAIAFDLAFSNPREAETWATFSEADLRHFGGDPQIESWLQNSIAFIRYQEGRFDEAATVARKSIALKALRLGPQSLDVGISVGGLVTSLMSAGKFDEALAESDRLLSIFERVLDPNDHFYLSVFSDRGKILIAKGRFAEARAWLDRAL
ncbi:MAG TPA: serine/threonine-protein kinase, partial [Polyangia bacterium]|nr:serine/threonine-protein kinase [Polyangia bacterium]